MEIKQIIITVRGTRGEAIKGTFDATGGLVAGTAEVKSYLGALSGEAAPSEPEPEPEPEVDDDQELA